ncbi:hypothetical protein CN616_22835 [Bacillus toyonensis]|uniref:hypothetical protein n=1 Tax=Bacillus toyonensis TaxID=155322 RepID=UPI000BF0AA36|nr:hypothetical protein [Bacillus toyonensis]PEM15199.1 hypothetical protein CN616_22835 [Bacillus toyonensis]
MLSSYTSWTVWNTEDEKKVIADNHGTIMDRETAYSVMCSILDFYENVSDTEIIEYNKQLIKERHEYYESMKEDIAEQVKKKREFKPTYMFIIKKTDESCYKFKFGGHRVRVFRDENKLEKIQEQLDIRLDNIEKESEVPIELVDSFIYVHNAPGVHKHILEMYGHFRDEFDWYVLEDRLLAEIIEFIKEQILEV